jgi:hypothetical protein
MITSSSRQRRSPKNKEPINIGNSGSSGLTIQDGSPESLLSSVKSSLPLPRRQQRRRKIPCWTSLAFRRRIRLVSLVCLVTFFMGACLYMVGNRSMQEEQEPFQKYQGAAVPEQEPFHRYKSVAIPEKQETQEKFERISTQAPMCTALQASDVSYTLVTQFSHDRLWMMEQHCARWGPHPISIAVLTNETVSSILQELMDLGCPRKQLFVQTLQPSPRQDYPVNVLRTMALKHVHTSHVTYVDVDFWESTDLHANLMREHVRHALAMDHKAALVVPAFMLLRQCREWRECPENNIPSMPHDQKDLFDLVRQRKATPFDPSNKGGHGSTRYKDWTAQSKELLPISCVLSNRYEPYLVVRYCRDLPPFQTAFSGYGKNKMTWVMQLRHAGYAFWQLGESFLVHYPHLDSSARLQWNGGENGKQLSKPKSSANLLDYKRAQTDQTFVEFRDWLAAAVPDETRIPTCDNAMDDDAKLWIVRPIKEDDGDDGTDNEEEDGDDGEEEAGDDGEEEEEESSGSDEENENGDDKADDKGNETADDKADGKADDKADDNGDDKETFRRQHFLQQHRHRDRQRPFGQ